MKSRKNRQDQARSSPIQHICSNAGRPVCPPRSISHTIWNGRFHCHSRNRSALVRSPRSKWHLACNKDLGRRKLAVSNRSLRRSRRFHRFCLCLCWSRGENLSLVLALLLLRVGARVSPMVDRRDRGFRPFLVGQECDMNALRVLDSRHLSPRALLRLWPCLLEKENG